MWQIIIHLSSISDNDENSLWQSSKCKKRTKKKIVSIAFGCTHTHHRTCFCRTHWRGKMLTFYQNDIHFDRFAAHWIFFVSHRFKTRIRPPMAMSFRPHNQINRIKRIGKRRFYFLFFGASIFILNTTIC